jgi:dolichyldiphosphatase
MTISRIITTGADAFPLYIMISSLLEGIIFQDNRGLVFFIMVCINFIINMVLKSILWKQNEQDATRPRGGTKAKCGDKYGNPSGHSQFASFFAVFWILYILNSKLFDNFIANALSCISLVLIAIIVGWSRVYIDCHTPSQVLLGSVIGIIVGAGGFFTTKDILINEKI